MKLETTAGDAVFTDQHIVRFGMREFTREGNRLLLNGRPVFLRGRIDCANYPLTGYAPMDKDEWLRAHEDPQGLGHQPHPLSLVVPARRGLRGGG